MTHVAPRWLLPGAFVLFAAWSLVVPINEAPDEPAHWQYARHLREHRTLPLYRAGFEEANSPPLGYLPFAPFARDVGSPDNVMTRDAEGQPVSLATPRVFLNTGEDFRRYWPQRAARLVAAAISTGTIYFVWQAAVAAGGPAVGLVAALVAALLPSFAFRAGHVSNDALVACMAAAATWGMVRLVREPFAWRVACLTSAAVGLAYLAKISAIALVPPFVLALWLSPPPAPWGRRVIRLAALGLAAAIVAPWSIRNVALYGDPFASEAMRTAVAHLITDRSLTSPYFVGEFPRMLAKSFVGVFGWAVILLPNGVYRACWLLFALAGAGAIAGVARRALDWRLAAVLAAAGFCALAIVVRINLEFTQPQGRYLFPGLPAFAVLVALGLRALPAGDRIARPAVVGLLLGAVNLYALAGVVVPAYYPAPLRTLASGERVMAPTLLQQLAVVVPDTYRVTGASPAWMTPVDAEAARFAAFEVELQADAPRPEQRGCLRFASTGRDLDANPALCFDWQADGRPHRIRVTLAGRDGWRDRVSHLKLQPFAPGTGVPGQAIRTADARLLPVR